MDVIIWKRSNLKAYVIQLRMEYSSKSPMMGKGSWSGIRQIEREKNTAYQMM